MDLHLLVEEQPIRTDRGQLITAAICPECNGTLSLTRRSMAHEWYRCEECGQPFCVNMPNPYQGSFYGLCVAEGR